MTLDASHIVFVVENKPVKQFRRGQWLNAAGAEALLISIASLLRGGFSADQQNQFRQNQRCLCPVDSSASFPVTRRQPPPSKKYDRPVSDRREALAHTLRLGQLLLRR